VLQDYIAIIAYLIINGASHLGTCDLVILR
jgi:hypothetical protein